MLYQLNKTIVSKLQDYFVWWGPSLPPRTLHQILGLCLPCTGSSPDTLVLRLAYIRPLTYMETHTSKLTSLFLLTVAGIVLVSWLMITISVQQISLSR